MPKLISAIPYFLARDLDETLAFYERLGFETAHNDGDYAIVKRDAVELHFGKDETHRDEDATLCRMQVEGIAELYDECRALDIVHPDGVLEDKPWGAREFSIYDPNNFLITFFEPAN